MVGEDNTFLSTTKYFDYFYYEVIGLGMGLKIIGRNTQYEELKKGKTEKRFNKLSSLANIQKPTNPW